MDDSGHESWLSEVVWEFNCKALSASRGSPTVSVPPVYISISVVTPGPLRVLLEVKLLAVFVSVCPDKNFQAQLKHWSPDMNALFAALMWKFFETVAFRINFTYWASVQFYVHKEWKIVS